MTVNNTNTFVIAQGNGITTNFNYSFLIPTDSEVAIYYTDLTGDTVQISSDQYIITGAGNPLGGTIIYPLAGSPIASGTSLAIIRSLPLLQLTDISNQGAFYPEVVEFALDYLTMALQQVDARISGFPIPPPPASEIPWAVVGGSADALTGTYSPAQTALSDGLILGFRASHDNTTATPTFSPDGLTAHVITEQGGLTLLAGDIKAAGEYFVRFNLAGVRWELYNPSITSWLNAVATAAQFIADTANLILTTDKIWAAAAQVTGSITASSNLSLDFSTFINLTLTFTGNVTFNAIANAKAGQMGVIEITQGAGGSHTLTLNSSFFSTAGAAAITLSTTAGARDLISYYVQSNGKIFLSMVGKGVA